MKRKFVKLVVLGAAITVAACNSNKKAAVKEDGTEVVKIRTPDATEAGKEEEKVETVAVQGKVGEINKGKDGYTAILTTDDGKIYYATISIPNLKDPKQYRSVQIGETIKVKGDSWKMEDDNYITVRELEK
ncbi:hypothetical protein CLV94_2311 [Flavobacterium endophyticum]|uniref:Lipoprotein n=1 Tax=Flavobacterium endophyticum TaxID=1540163 RepID=A0A495MF92_9FLAO|nr:hypothetical protein [Flavobacterium endophyticum]RKS23403.1 hypothetical protein CLV94_2311 [Flavobacterium endophyticum]